MDYAAGYDGCRRPGRTPDTGSVATLRASIDVGSYRGWRLLDALTLGPRRRRHRLEIELRQPDSPLYRTPARPREWTPGRVPRQPRRGRRGRPVVRHLVGVVAVLGLVAVAVMRQHDDHAAALHGVPGPAAGRHASRLLPRVSGPAGTGGYAFEQVHADGTPVTYDPCRPIHVMVNLRGAPAGSGRIIRQALARLQTATGLELVDDGMTSEPPDEHRKPVQQRRYGNRWAPVLIAWASARSYPELRGTVVGVGGSTRSGSGHDVHYVTGQVVLDLPAFKELVSTHQGAMAMRIALHELGHVVGLAHVSDPAQVMYEETVTGAVDYADGDRRGLALLGDGRCRP